MWSLVCGVAAVFSVSVSNMTIKDPSVKICRNCGTVKSANKTTLLTIIPKHMCAIIIMLQHVERSWLT